VRLPDTETLNRDLLRDTLHTCAKLFREPQIAVEMLRSSWHQIGCRSLSKGSKEDQLVCEMTVHSGTSGHVLQQCRCHEAPNRLGTSSERTRTISTKQAASRALRPDGQACSGMRRRCVVDLFNLAGQTNFTESRFAHPCHAGTDATLFELTGERDTAHLMELPLFCQDECFESPLYGLYSQLYDPSAEWAVPRANA
jgi:hypothetical protein